MNNLLRMLLNELVVTRFRVQILRAFATALLVSCTLMATALWLGTLGRDGNLVPVDALTIAHSVVTAGESAQPVFEFILPSGEKGQATLTGPADPADYPIGTAQRLRYDPRDPTHLYTLASRWPVWIAWLIGIPAALMLVATLLLGRFVWRLLSGPQPRRSRKPK